MRNDLIFLIKTSTMNFDPNNKIVQLCAKGMELVDDEAKTVFTQAWNESTSDFERFVAAHYLARHQETVSDKLKWDLTALENALRSNEDVSGALPSLYLNIAKCHEDLGDKARAKLNYERALSHTENLLNDGYGDLIRQGILNGLDRIA